MNAEESAARIIRAVAKSLAPERAVELWNGERIGPKAGPVIKINDPMAVRQLALRPNLSTVVELWISRAIDIENGSIFDIAEAAPKGRFKQQLRDLPKWRLLKDLPPLIFARRANKTSGLGGKNPFASGSDKDAITHHYDVSNAFYRLFLDERMVYTCAYFKDWANSLDQAQEDKLEHICRKLRLKPGETLLDIGCGWGALLIYAASPSGSNQRPVLRRSVQRRSRRAGRRHPPPPAAD